MVVGSILTVIAAMSFYPGWQTPQAGIFIVDLLVLVSNGVQKGPPIGVEEGPPFQII
jgi:hypothetical protein